MTTNTLSLINFFTTRPSLNLESFARECGVNHSTIWRMLNGRCNPGRATVARITAVAIRYGLVISGDTCSS